MKELAECVGLWLAEGGKTLKREVTFTNNCIDLILFFSKTINKIYLGKNKPRVYVYSPSPRKLFDSFNGFKVNYYQDRRANRTYFMYRLADSRFAKEWKDLVNAIKSNEELYPEILRGIFAGDGNIKHSQKHNNSRAIRIAQKWTDGRIYIEMLLKYFNIDFTYDPKCRAYTITASQLEKANKIDIAALHPEKEAKFRKMINSVKEKHYPPGYLKTKILSRLDSMYRVKDLADIMCRSDFRVLEVLQELRRERKVDYVKRRSGVYWAKKEVIESVIFARKIVLLKAVDTFKNNTEVGRAVNVSRKVARRRLTKLKMEGLVEQTDGKWISTQEGENLLCGIDESGSEL